MTFLGKSNFGILCFLGYVLLRNVAVSLEAKEENRPYEFSFNIVDFQHRFEKKDSEGIITGEYGFVTADGVYHETSYATGKNGDFIITRMRNRKITSLEDAREIFRDRPEAAKKLVEAVARACSSCNIPIKETTTPIPVSTTKPNLSPLLRGMMKTLVKSRRTGEKARKESPQERNKIPENSKDLLSQRRGKSLEEGTVRSMVDSAKKNNSSSINTVTNDRVLEKMANGLSYQFNYTITSHEHQEDGYRSGEKDGSYRARSESGIDTRVKYVSNEFGHQPNISFVPRTNSGDETQRLKGYSFLWYSS